jgi:hypothetical protein
MRLIIYLLLFIPLITFSQGWEKNYGGIEDDWAFDVQQTSDGGYILIGSSCSF